MLPILINFVIPPQYLQVLSIEQKSVQHSLMHASGYSSTIKQLLKETLLRIKFYCRVAMYLYGGTLPRWERACMVFTVLQVNCIVLNLTIFLKSINC